MYIKRKKTSPHLKYIHLTIHVFSLPVYDIKHMNYWTPIELQIKSMKLI